VNQFRKWTQEQNEAFRTDWLAGMSLAEMAEKYNYSTNGGVSQKAARDDLPPRAKRHAALTGGRWVAKGSVRVWIPY
jgi:hypothetical protein